MELVISETPTSMWSYHLREVKDGKRYLTGGAPQALCGAKLGWDTQFPLKAWGHVDHMPSMWCVECAAIRSAAGLDHAHHGR